MQTQDSPTVAELLSPRAKTSAEYLDKWLGERELDKSWATLEPITDFIPQFRLVTHDRNGRPRPELSAIRLHDGKYRNPAKSGTVIYAPKPDSIPKFAAAPEVWIAEGHGKTIALVGMGYPVLGISGCEMWHVAGDKTQLHPDLKDHIQKGNTVNVVMDGDFRDKTKRVGINADELLSHLRALGAKARLLNLKRDHKIDDLIASWRRAGKDPHKEIQAVGFIDGVPLDIPIVSAAEILARPSPKWIVNNLIPPGELTAIVGETSCGKTFLTMDLMLAVARGLPYWFGQRIKQTGLVIHITLEGTNLANRLRAYREHHELKDEGMGNYAAIEVPINLREDGEALIRAITQRASLTGKPVVLIAVDTVNRALGGGDENSSVDMGAFLANAERVKAAFPGCGVLLVHHFGKNVTSGARGHSSFSANVGAELTVEDKAGIRTVTIQKQREGRTDLRFNFTLLPVELGNDEDGERITSCVVMPSVAPPMQQGDDHFSRYEMLFEFYVGDQNNSQPMSKRKIADNVPNIRSKRSKVTGTEFRATLMWAVDKGYATLAGKQPKRGEAYELHRLPKGKYQ